MAMQVQEKWSVMSPRTSWLCPPRLMNADPSGQSQAGDWRVSETLSGPVAMAIEATSVYHLEFVEQAYRKGHTMYLIDGYRPGSAIAKASAVGPRPTPRWTPSSFCVISPMSKKTCDPESATGGLSPGPGLAASAGASWCRPRTTLRQSLRVCPSYAPPLRHCCARCSQVDQPILKRLRDSSRVWLDGGCPALCRHRRHRTALQHRPQAMLYRRGPFHSADAYIAFMGMDVRVRDSGRSRGRRKLTKKGDSELRRLLYMAAMTACRSSTWKPFYQRALARGLTRIQALVALARKLARIAFALFKNQSVYQSKVSTQD
ncbi:MAG: transposase [Dokdonella sp.]